MAWTVTFMSISRYFQKPKYGLVAVLLTIAGCNPEKTSRNDALETSDNDAATISEARRLKPERAEVPYNDKRIAQIAWAYFQNNTQASTGLVNSVNRYPSATIWDIGSQLLAIICAERLSIISSSLFDQHLEKVLATLAEIPLYDGLLPNKAYHTKTLNMVNYANLPVPEGIGWSAIDIARLMVPLSIISDQYPSYAAAVHKVTSRFDLAKVVENGVLYGARPGSNSRSERVQEGRLGYEEYAATALLRAGLDARVARRTDDTIKFTDIMGFSIASDARSRDRYGSNVITTSEPYILYGLEFGFDADIRAIAEQLLAVQEERWLRTGILTALSEGHLDQAPYFTYNGIIANDKAWASVSPAGELLTDVRSLSTTASFGWDQLMPTAYTKRLLARIIEAGEDGIGWYQGFYEVDGRLNKALTVNTNAIVLEAIYHKRFGPLMPKR